MTCDQFAALIKQKSLATITITEAAALYVHLEKCRACMRKAATFRRKKMREDPVLSKQVALFARKVMKPSIERHLNEDPEASR